METFGLDEGTLEKLRSSTAVAFPLVEDPITMLAAGLRLERPALVAALRRMFEAKALLGALGEPNPRLDQATEALVYTGSPPPERWSDGAVRRWWGSAAGGRFVASYMNLAKPVKDGVSPLVRAFKLGIPSPRGGPLDPSGDRTFFADEQDCHVPPMSHEEIHLADRLFAPYPFDPAGDFWEQMAEGTGLTAAQSLAVSKRLVLRRVWRRFALRYDCSHAGLKGCGLATWKLPEAFVPSAAEALAAVSGTGDVMMRTPAEKDGPNLFVLFLAREPGAGEKAAREVGRQWQRPPASWTALVLH